MAEQSFDLTRCLAEVRQRNETAARALVEHLLPLVGKLVRAHLPQRDDPEDLMQEVFLKVFSRIEQFRGQVPFEHWVSRVAVSTCIDRLRAQQRRPLWRWSDLSEQEQAVLQTVAAETESTETHGSSAWEILEKLLASLSATERMLITFLDLEEKTPAEVSALTGWNSGVVRIRAFRARRKLKALYEQLEDGKL
jgi:RNA polymerase sigma factor (sigma-70 family)